MSQFPRSPLRPTAVLGALLLPALLLLAGAAPAGEAFAAIRVVRMAPGAPERPQVTLPAGYSLHVQGDYEVESASEYYVFLRGPAGRAAGVRIAWPGSRIAAVIHGDTRLALASDDGGTSVRCDVPVAAPTLREAWPTLEVHSFPSEAGLAIRVEHNDERRRAGWYAANPWVGPQARAAITFMAATRYVLRDWGLHRALGAAGRGSLSLLGFESNNPLHFDQPAHWHLIHYLPAYTGTQVPHFYLDAEGRITGNKVQVMDRPDIADRHLGPGEPMVCTDAAGAVVMALRIRADGGLDLGPAVGDWRYAIVPDGPGRGFAGAARILRRGAPWARVATSDDVERGILSWTAEALDGRHAPHRDTWLYDPLTGAPRRAATPVSGVPHAVPGRIAARDFDLGGDGLAYHETAAAHTGSWCRPGEGVDLSGGGAGQAFLAGTAPGEWVRYTVDVARAGTYAVSARVAAPGAGGRFRIEQEGLAPAAACAVPATGGWQSWRDVAMAPIDLPAGRQALRVAIQAGGFNLERLDLTLLRPAPLAAKVNFQPMGAPGVAGYAVDCGQAYQERGGMASGWDRDLAGLCRDRGVLADQLRDTLVHVPAGARWELAVPDGWYEVHLVAGDPAFIDGSPRFDVEGVRAVAGTLSRAAPFIEGTVTVWVGDGRLTVAAAAGCVNGKLCVVEVMGVPTGKG